MEHRAFPPATPHPEIRAFLALTIPLFILISAGVSYGVKQIYPFFPSPKSSANILVSLSDDLVRFHTINLNEATVEELIRLKGVGYVIASRIVAYRQKNGPFMSVEEIINVKGIGAKKLQMIRNFVVVK